MTSYHLMKGTQIKVLKDGSWISYTLKEGIDVANVVGRTTEVIAPMKLVVTGEYKGFKIKYCPTQLLTRRNKLKGDGSCKKCGGCGYIPAFSHVQGGKCFSCGPVS